MKLKATVLIPTYNHGPLLEYALKSALEQSVQDIEIFIIGDGIPEEVRPVVENLLKIYPRIRFFDHPKSPRTGELYRHQALAEAQGEIVCYLSDDDLWLPNHVESLYRLLQQADFANAVAVRIHPDDTLDYLPIDLGRKKFVRMILSGGNRIPLSCGAHTLDFYRRLPYGWRTTPLGLPTDLYQWQQCMSQPGVRLASLFYPTMLNFPDILRKHYSLEQRRDELARYYQIVHDPVASLHLVSRLFEIALKAQTAGPQNPGDFIWERLGRSVIGCTLKHMMKRPLF